MLTNAHSCVMQTLHGFENLTITKGRSSWLFLDDHHPHCPRGHHTWAQPVLELHVSWIVDYVLFCIREGNGTPLQYSCLENPWMEEPGRLQSMGSLRVRHDWVTSFSLFIFMHWRRKWQPTPVLLPGESQGRRSLAGCRLWGCTELGTTEAT